MDIIPCNKIQEFLDKHPVKHTSLLLTQECPIEIVSVKGEIGNREEILVRRKAKLK